MVFKIALALLVFLAAPVAALDDLDDLDIDGPPAPGPARAASPAPSASPGGLDDIDIPELTGPVPGPASGPKTSEAPAPAVLPGGFKDAWNLTTALALVIDLKRDARPKDAPLKSWQSLRASQEISAILAGAPDAPAALRGFLERRLMALTGRTPLDGGVDDPGIDLDSLDSAPAPAPAPRAAATAAALDPDVERLCHQLAVLDRSDLAHAQELARDLAAKAGDPSAAAAISAAVAHGPELAQYVMRARALIHRPPGGAWVVRQLASGNTDAIGAAVDYVRDAATSAEQKDALAAVAARTLSGPAARNVVESIGLTGTAELVPDLEAAAKDAPAELARAAGEAIGRIRQRDEERTALSDGLLGHDRRDAAARANQQGLPLYRAGRYREALDRFRLACELDATDQIHFYNLGNALYRLGNVTAASEHLQKAIALGRDELPVYEMAIGALRDLGDRERLVAFLEERATRVQYSAIVVLLYLNIAHEHVAAGEPDRAQQALEIAFARAVPEKYIPALLVRRGDAFMLSGQPGVARANYQRALALAPEYQRAQDGLLRAESYQAPGAATAAAGPSPTGPAAGAGETDPFGGAGELNIDLDAGPAVKPTPAPTPQASAGPKGLDDLDIDL